MKDVWQESVNVNEFVKKMQTTYLDNVATGIKARSHYSIIDMTGGNIYITDAQNKENALFLSSSIIAFTDDNWLTAKMAITSDGIIKEEIVCEKVNIDKDFKIC